MCLRLFEGKELDDEEIPSILLVLGPGTRKEKKKYITYTCIRHEVKYIGTGTHDIPAVKNGQVNCLLLARVYIKNQRDRSVFKAQWKTSFYILDLCLPSLETTPSFLPCRAV